MKKLNDYDLLVIKNYFDNYGVENEKELCKKDKGVGTKLRKNFGTIDHFNKYCKKRGVSFFDNS